MIANLSEVPQTLVGFDVGLEVEDIDLMTYLVPGGGFEMAFATRHMNSCVRED